MPKNWHWRVKLDYWQRNYKSSVPSLQPPQQRTCCFLWRQKYQFKRELFFGPIKCGLVLEIFEKIKLLVLFLLLLLDFTQNGEQKRKAVNMRETGFQETVCVKHQKIRFYAKTSFLHLVRYICLYGQFFNCRLHYFDRYLDTPGVAI